MMVFFGMLPHDRMERIIHTTLQQIQQHAPKCWNGADIPMANVGRLFGAKLYVPIQNEDQWPIPKNDNDNDDDNTPEDASLPKLEYLSGVWLSKVYMGNADQHLFQRTTILRRMPILHHNHLPYPNWNIYPACGCPKSTWAMPTNTFSNGSTTRNYTSKTTMACRFIPTMDTVTGLSPIPIHRVMRGLWYKAMTPIRRSSSFSSRYRMS